MKKLDINIKLSEPVVDADKKTELKPYEVGARWLGIMLERAINKPDAKTMRPTVNVGMEVQRKYFQVMDAIDKAKDGVVELDNDAFTFLDRKFHQAEMSVNKGVAEILVALSDAINKAKIPVKDVEKTK